MNCVFLGEQPGRFQKCATHGRCVLEGKSRKAASCEHCPDKLLESDDDFPKRWRDPLHIITSDRERTHCLRNLLKGRPTFLVCGGPSGKPHLNDLNRRGVFSLAVNNAAGNIVRPQAFVHTDPPIKFSHSIWWDPAIIKFTPIPKMSPGRNLTRIKQDNIFRASVPSPECPNTWGFLRNDWMMPDKSFFLDEGSCWGNQDAGVARTGQPKTVCTMLCAIRLLYYLGSRRIYLVGVDFNMVPGQEYAFNQAKENDGASDSNNRQFQVVNDWLVQMTTSRVFKQFGLEIYNCYDSSGLRAFPYVPFAAALADVVGPVEQVPDLSGWYEKQDCPKCCSWHVKWEGDAGTCQYCGLQWNLGGRPKFPKSERKKHQKERLSK